MYQIRFSLAGMLVVGLFGLACVSSDEVVAPDLSLSESAQLGAEPRLGQLDMEREEIDLIGWLEWRVIRNMYTIQNGFEEFAELNGGIYPTHESATTPDGRRLEELLPEGHYPINPFTGSPIHFSWDAGPHATPGEIAATTATEDGYIIRGYGADTSSLLDLILTNE